MTIGDVILEILDQVLYEEAGITRFEAMYLGADDYLDESEL